MNITCHINRLLILLLISMPTAAWAASKAGEVKTIKGEVSATLDQETRTLSKGDDVFANDLIATEGGALVEIKFVDDSKFLVGPDSEMQVDKFSYNKPDTENKLSTRLLKGSFRFVTGLIARYKPESMEVSTAVATIGIRGTTVAVVASATAATVVLEEPEDRSRDTAIEVANQFGSVTIDEPGYGTEIPDQFSPPSPPQRMRLRTINNLMRSLQSIQRINIPRPRH
ncbi:MAG: FecR domain-containing protein [Thiotrichales bacterium]|nr:FecR domain-containing protein [Thiotrichales bacterium]